MKQRKVFSFNSELYKVTWIQKVLMDVHHAVQENYERKRLKQTYCPFS